MNAFRFPPLVPIAVLLCATVIASLGTYYLWTDRPLYALLASGFLLFGGARMLPSKHLLAHSVSLGFCIGAFLGGILGAFHFFHAA